MENNNSNGCSYSTLKNSDRASVLGVGSFTTCDQPGQAFVTGPNYTVPLMCASGTPAVYPPAYDTLTHGQKYQCGGYFDMQKAYPLASCSSCNVTYTSRPCTSSIGSQCGASGSQFIRK